VNGITPFLKTCGYNPKKDVIFLPMSGLLGHNIVKGVKDTVAPWSDPPLHSHSSEYIGVWTVATRLQEPLSYVQLPMIS